MDRMIGIACSGLTLIPGGSVKALATDMSHEKATGIELCLAGVAAGWLSGSHVVACSSA
jgi:hypothetical protein